MKAAIKILTAALLFYQANLALSWGVPKIAGDGEFPFHAAIMWKPSPVSSHFTSCGGAILDEYWILTSAYCVSYVPDFGYNFIKVGNQDVNVDDDRVQIHQIEKFIVHEKYPGRSPVLSNLAYYDIGLIKLSTRLAFNGFVKPIKLPRANSWLLGTHKLDYNLVISGWGVFAYHLNPDRPTTMRTVTLPVVANKACTDSIKRIFPHFQMGEMQMCTRPLDGTLAACIGNWGGPLVQYDSKNEPELVGLVGWSSVVCNTNYMPPVYTRVGYFVNWIKKQMKSYVPSESGSTSGSRSGSRSGSVSGAAVAATSS